MSKTIFLIRHAESAENVLMQGVVRSLNALKQFSLPSMSDLKSSVDLASAMVSGANDECQLSLNGEAQVAEVRNWLLSNEDTLKLLKEAPVVVHSPMIRAKMTCDGLFNGIIPTSTEVMALDCLREIVPVDYVNPSRWAQAQTRVADFEKWLAQRPESSVVVVGHSHYFKSLLGVDFKFSNCEIWKVLFQPHALNEDDPKKKWTNLERICGSSTAQATFGAEGPEAWQTKPAATELEQKS